MSELGPSDRIDRLFAKWELRPEKKRMFGGMTWLLSGNMACATLASGMVIVRIPAHLKQSVLALDHVRQAEMNGRTMNNWVMCDASVLDAATFAAVLTIGRDYALSLPAK